MSARQKRERLALRLNAWIAQEIGAGSMAQARTYGGELTTTTYVLDDTRLNAPDLNAASELHVELALDLRCLSDLRAGKEVGARAWMLVAERIGADGPLPTLADVLATQREPMSGTLVMSREVARQLPELRTETAYGADPLDGLRYAEAMAGHEIFVVPDLSPLTQTKAERAELNPNPRGPAQRKRRGR